MKLIKLFLIVTFSFLFAQLSQAQVEARVHQVFEVRNATQIAINIDETQHEVNIRESYSTVIIVEAVITLNHATPTDMEELISAGRYKVDMKVADGVATFHAKEDKSPIVLNGKEAEEYIIYNISVPEYLEY